jgi:AraC-like DNA-binding protein
MPGSAKKDVQSCQNDQNVVCWVCRIAPNLLGRRSIETNEAHQGRHPRLRRSDTPNQNLLGLGALAAELASDGISVRDLFARTGVDAAQLEDAHARVSHRQRIAIYRNAKALAKRPDIGLLAGARQRISDYGIYGYAMVSSPTFGDALLFSLDHVTMAGPAVKQISFRIEGSTAILRSDGLDTLGDLLPFAAAFWRSSMTSLCSRGTRSPISDDAHDFPVCPPNALAQLRTDVQLSDRLRCRQDGMALQRGRTRQPCPNANPITAKICQQVCDVVMTASPGESELVRKIRVACFNSPKRFPPAGAIASELGFSLRTLHRRLAEDGLSYQSIVDDMRQTVATELLENTHLGIEQIAERVGFADAVSFRKAFKKWTGRSPSDFRVRDTQP